VLSPCGENFAEGTGLRLSRTILFRGELEGLFQADEFGGETQGFEGLAFLLPRFVLVG
jgi:hypothetical protein